MDFVKSETYLLCWALFLAPLVQVIESPLSLQVCHSIAESSFFKIFVSACVLISLASLCTFGWEPRQMYTEINDYINIWMVALCYFEVHPIRPFPGLRFFHRSLHCQPGTSRKSLPAGHIPSVFAPKCQGKNLSCTPISEARVLGFQSHCCGQIRVQSVRMISRRHFEYPEHNLQCN